MIHPLQNGAGGNVDCTEKEELLQIISVLRKFTELLETNLLD